MRDSLRHFVAEFLGTFALVFIGGLALASARQADSAVPLLQSALATGLILAVMVSAMMRIAGHFNPAVTVAFVVTRRIEPAMAGLYVIAQLTGAMAAAYVLKATIPAELFGLVRGGGQAIALDVSWGKAFALEALATLFLVVAYFGTAVDPQSPRVGGFAIGLAQTVGILALGPLTGGSMNPARALGPAVATGIWEGQGVYWLGPIAGAVVAALVYDRLFLPRGAEPFDHGALEPVASDVAAPPRARKHGGHHHA